MNNLTLKNKLFEVLENRITKFLESNTSDYDNTSEYQQNMPIFDDILPFEIYKIVTLYKNFQESFFDIWENLAEIVTDHGSVLAKNQYTVRGTVKIGRLQRIQSMMNQLEFPKEGTDPKWNAALAYILKGKGAPLPVSIQCDFFTENVQTGERTAFMVTQQLPNYKKSRQRKENILKLLAMDSQVVDVAYFALLYNPFGQKSDYAQALPNKWFDPTQDQIVIVGAEFWDKIGGVGTYEVIIEAINDISLLYKDRIYQKLAKI